MPSKSSNPHVIGLLASHTVALLGGVYLHHRWVAGDLWELSQIRLENRMSTLRWVIAGSLTLGGGVLYLKVRGRRAGLRLTGATTNN